MGPKATTLIPCNNQQRPLLQPTPPLPTPPPSPRSSSHVEALRRELGPKPPIYRGRATVVEQFTGVVSLFGGVGVITPRLYSTYLQSTAGDFIRIFSLHCSLFTRLRLYCFGGVCKLSVGGCAFRVCRVTCGGGWGLLCSLFTYHRHRKYNYGFASCLRLVRPAQPSLSLPTQDHLLRASEFGRENSLCTPIPILLPVPCFTSLSFQSIDSRCLFGLRSRERANNEITRSQPMEGKAGAAWSARLGGREGLRKRRVTSITVKALLESGSWESQGLRWCRRIRREKRPARFGDRARHDVRLLAVSNWALLDFALQVAPTLGPVRRWVNEARAHATTLPLPPPPSP